MDIVHRNILNKYSDVHIWVWENTIDPEQNAPESFFSLCACVCELFVSNSKCYQLYILFSFLFGFYNHSKLFPSFLAMLINHSKLTIYNHSKLFS